MIRTVLVPVLVVLGLILLAVAQFYPGYVQAPERRTWTEEKAKQLQEASAKYHQLQYGPTQRRPTPQQVEQHKADFAAAKKEYERQDAELLEQQNAGNDVARICWITALCLIGGGVVLVLLVPNSKGK